MSGRNISNKECKKSKIFRNKHKMELPEVYNNDFLLLCWFTLYMDVAM
jgi:hypothetical protein